MMRASLRALLSEIVDYAGLFPPAGLPLDKAIRNYAFPVGSGFQRLFLTQTGAWVVLAHGKVRRHAVNRGRHAVEGQALDLFDEFEDGGKLPLQPRLLVRVESQAGQPSHLLHVETCRHRAGL